MTAATTHITANIDAVRERIARACQRAGRPSDDVRLIGVSKTVPAEIVAEAVRAGLKDLGENRVQEGSAKHEELAAMGLHPRWHLIGHLQTNKVRSAIEHFSSIHSVDSERLLDAIASRTSEPMAVFIEVNVSGEATKEGVDPADLPPLLEHARGLPTIDVRGLMTVAPLDAAEAELRTHFASLRTLANRHNLQGLSMGMTNDFAIAIEEGATHVRVGRAIFGERR